jgi:hypothetical protein
MSRSPGNASVSVAAADVGEGAAHVDRLGGDLGRALGITGSFIGSGFVEKSDNFRIWGSISWDTETI